MYHLHLWKKVTVELKRYVSITYQLLHAATQSKTAKKSEAAGKKVHKTLEARPGYEPLDLNFEDVKAAFKGKTNWELIRGYLVYQLCSIQFLTDNKEKIVAATRKLTGDTIFAFLMKMSFYGHFVAGEDEYKIQPFLQRMSRFGINPMLDYSVEDELSEDQAVELERKAVTPAAGLKAKNDLKQFNFDTRIADRRYKSQARTFFYLNESTCERNMETHLRCLEALSMNPARKGIVAIKITALGRPQLLLALSEAVLRTRRFFNQIMGGSGSVLDHHVPIDELRRKLDAAKFDKAQADRFIQQVEVDKQNIVHIFPWAGIINDKYELNETFRVPDLKTGKMVRIMTQLTKSEEEMFRNMIRRLNTIIKAAEIMGLSLMVDAEHSYFQSAINRITIEFMRKYNKKRDIVQNTYQNYMKMTYNELKTDLEQARLQDFYFSAKLVRGAYLEHERERAKVLGYEDPTNPSYEATTKMYHDSLDLCMKEIVRCKKAGTRKVSIMVASHNEDTCRYTIEKMLEYGIKPDDGLISFGQLVGMCDHMTYPLGQAGYSAYKYTPYGPIVHVIPYLLRRMQENKGILAKVKKEKTLLATEIRRRFMRGQLIYTPKGNYKPI